MAEATVGVICVAVGINLVLIPENIVWTTPFFLVPLLLSTMFLTNRATRVLYGLILVFLLLLNPRVPEGYKIPYALSSLGYLLTGIVVLFQAWYRASYEAFRLGQLMESENRYRTLLSEAYLGILVVQENIIQEVSEPLSERLGYAHEALLGVEISNVMSRLVLQDGVQNSGYEYVRDDEQVIHFEYVATTDTYRGRPATILAMRDISERKRTEEALAQAQRIDSLGLMAGGIAHDFNNLLTGIKGQATIAKMKLPEDEPAQKHLVKLLASTERAADLTRQLLAYAGKGNFETRVFDFNKFTYDIVSLLRSNLPTHVRLRRDLVDRPLPIKADPGQLQQILLNLVINASEAIGDQEGTISVDTRVVNLLSQDFKSIRMWGGERLAAGEYIQCTVTDDGCGMDAATMKRIFDPFYTTKKSGTGLGLAATKGALKAHGGDLQLYSTVGKGTRFVIWLPLSTETTPDRVERDDSAENITPESTTILVIDDEKNVRDTLKEMLQIAGYRVLTAENGHDGLNLYKAQKHDIDLIMLDMQMPEMNGETTYYRLQAIDPAVRVLICSGYSDLSAVSRLTVDNQLAFIAKPFEFNNLKLSVQNALRKTLVAA